VPFLRFSRVFKKYKPQFGASQSVIAGFTPLHASQNRWTASLYVALGMALNLASRAFAKMSGWNTLSPQY
jgi:hypothetical protein